MFQSPTRFLSPALSVSVLRRAVCTSSEPGVAMSFHVESMSHQLSPKSTAVSATHP